MRNYIWDSYDCISSDAGYVMNRLQAEGWKKLIFSSGGDFNSDSIQGYRPMTKQEIRDREKRIKNAEMEELSNLRKLAKKYGYKLIKVKD
jgi:hypothetical protein